MINRIHNRLGTAGFVVAIVALVAALTGAAFAAGGLTKPQEKQVKKIAKKYAGKPGPAGSQGPQGSRGDQGPKGDTGAPGTPGQDGQDGQDGEDGACSVGNPDCVLPSKATMTGDWSFSTPSAGQEEWVLTTISFPLQAVPAPEYSAPGENVKWIGLETKAEREANGLPDYDRTHCPGTPADPAALPGYLCIYAAELHNVFQGEHEQPIVETLQGHRTADTNSGLTLGFYLQNTSIEGFGYGSWAFTAS
jgi:Collagen triple helix repeat (20 copies)